MRHHTLISVTAAVCTMAYAQPAHAQESGAEKAKALFEEAMAAHARGDYREASALLAKAYAYDSNLVYQYNRVMMLQLNGDYSEALEVLDIYEEPMLSDPEGRFQNIPMLREKLTAQAVEKEEMERMMAEKKAAEGEAPESRGPDARDAGGEDPAASNPYDGGHHHDRRDHDRRLEPIEEPMEGPSPPVLGYTLIGTGVVAAAAGGLLLSGLFAPEYSESDYGSVQWRAERTIQTQQTAGLGLLAGGAVLAGAGVAFVLMHDDGETDQNVTLTDDVNPEPPVSLEIAPAVGPRFAGATLIGRF